MVFRASNHDNASLFPLKFCIAIITAYNWTYHYHYPITVTVVLQQGSTHVYKKILEYIHTIAGNHM